ncbi:MAG: site-2 protease family protein [Acidimicrobiales bacterium]|jgi:Zn-dependent protease
MGRSFRIGSIKGVPIRLHWSFPLLALLVVIPAGSKLTALSFLEGLAWIAALFVCVVLHELSHSFVARRRGFVVRDIVLLPIGGASEISGLPGPPPDELAIAIAGPLASVALGLLLALVGYMAGAHLWPPALFSGALLSRLMWVNFLLAGFNLLPAIPMDGGRVLRALLARKRGDLRATVLAVRIGRLMGLAMILFGLRFDLWLSLIGVFVVVGAGGEQRAAAVRSATGGLKVTDVMVHDPATLEVSFPLSVVAPFLEATPGRVLPVVDHGRYVGLIAADHLAGRAGALLVGDATDHLPPSLAPQDPLYPVAVESLLAGRRRAAAVLEDGQVVGVLYAAHLEAALRRATAGLGASSTQR